MVFKKCLQAKALNYCNLTLGRYAGLNEALSQFSMTLCVILACAQSSVQKEGAGLVIISSASAPVPIEYQSLLWLCKSRATSETMDQKRESVKPLLSSSVTISENLRSRWLSTLGPWATYGCKLSVVHHSL